MHYYYYLSNIYIYILLMYDDVDKHKTYYTVHVYFFNCVVHNTISLLVCLLYVSSQYV